MEKKKLTKQEKIEILNNRIKAAKQKISKIEGVEKRKQRRERARKLIEIGAYFFGDHYLQIHDAIKTQEQKTIDLKQKLQEWQTKNF